MNILSFIKRFISKKNIILVLKINNFKTNSDKNEAHKEAIILHYIYNEIKDAFKEKNINKIVGKTFYVSLKKNNKNRKKITAFKNKITKIVDIDISYL